MTEPLKILLSGTALIGSVLLGQAEAVIGNPQLVIMIERLGSFALLVLAIVGTIWVIAPKIIQWIERREEVFVKHLESVETKRERTHEEIIKELRCGNDLIKDLSATIKSRPCQKP